MIKSIKDKGLRLFWEEGNARKLKVQQTDRVRRILGALEAARQPSDVNLPGYRMHPLGKMAPGRYALEASANYRITFGFDGEGFTDLDLEDYH